MNEYDVLFTGHEEINFYPADSYEEVLQNVITILSTPKYSVPMFREFGIGHSMLDDAINISRAKLSAEIIQAIRKYEPRAKISRIDFSGDESGKLNVRLKIAIEGG